MAPNSKKVAPESCFRHVKSYDKIYPNIGFTSQATQRCVVALDTGTESSFIRKDLMNTMMCDKIKLSRKRKVGDANNRKVHTSGTINFGVEFGNRLERVKFNVVERLATNTLLGFDYCDRHIESIKTEQLILELDSGKTVQISHNTGAKSRNAVPLHEGQRYPKGEKSALTETKYLNR